MMKLDPSDLYRDLEKLCSSDDPKIVRLKMELNRRFGKSSTYGKSDRKLSGELDREAPTLARYMNVAGRAMGEAYAKAVSVTALRGVPLAAHNYARHFESLRRVVREAASAGAALVNLQTLLLRATESAQLEGALMLSQIIQDPTARQPLPPEKISQMRRTTAMQAECLAALEAQQSRLLEVGEELLSEISDATTALGEDFTFKLLCHCSRKAMADESTVDGWRLFGTWWMTRSPLYARAVLAVRMA